MTFIAICTRFVGRQCNVCCDRHLIYLGMPVTHCMIHGGAYLRMLLTAMPTRCVAKWSRICCGLAISRRAHVEHVNDHVRHAILRYVVYIHGYSVCVYNVTHGLRVYAVTYCVSKCEYSCMWSTMPYIVDWYREWCYALTVFHMMWCRHCYILRWRIQCRGLCYDTVIYYADIHM